MAHGGKQEMIELKTKGRDSIIFVNNKPTVTTRDYNEALGLLRAAERVYMPKEERRGRQASRW